MAWCAPGGATKLDIMRKNGRGAFPQTSSDNASKTDGEGICLRP